MMTDRPEHPELHYVPGLPGRPRVPCAHRNRGRFAMYRYETPAPRGTLQLPLYGDDRRLSETTGRFALYLDGHLQTRDADLTAVLKSMAAFGITDPTMLQLRSLLSISYVGNCQVRLSQRPKLDPDEPYDVVVTAPPLSSPDG